MDEELKETIELEIEMLKDTLDTLKDLPEDRKVYINNGFICVETPKEEAIQILEEELKELEKVLRESQ